MPDAAAWVGDVAAASRNDVDVSMLDDLPGRWTAVIADVHAVHAGPRREIARHLANEREEVRPVGGVKLLDSRHVTARHDEHVSFGDGKGILEGDRRVTQTRRTVCDARTERTVVHQQEYRVRVEGA